MKLHEKIVEAAHTGVTVTPEARARRVLRAASENVPDEVVEAAAIEIGIRDLRETSVFRECGADDLINIVKSILSSADSELDIARRLKWRLQARAAISAGLAKCAEEE